MDVGSVASPGVLGKLHLPPSLPAVDGCGGVAICRVILSAQKRVLWVVAQWADGPEWHHGLHEVSCSGCDK